MRVLVLGHSNAYLTEAYDSGIELFNLLDADGLSLPGLRVRNPPIPIDDRTSVPEILSALYRRGLQDGLDAVFTNSEQGMVTAACLARLLGARGVPVEVALAMRDKSHQKALIRKAGLPVAETAVIEGLSPDLSEADRLDFPVVVKPLDQQGSYGVAVARDTGHLRTVLDASRATFGRMNWLVESYVRGAEYHVDGIVGTDRIEFFSVGRYGRNLIEVRGDQSAASVIVPEPEEPALHRRFRDFAGAAVQALGLTSSVFHLEIFDDPDRGPVFSECAARCGGAGVLPAIRAATGLDLERAAFQQAVLGSFDRPESTRPLSSAGWATVPMPQGRITRLPDADTIRAAPDVVDVRMRFDLGENVGPRRRVDWSRAGVVVTGRDTVAVAGRLSDLVHDLSTGVHVIPPAPQLGR